MNKSFGIFNLKETDCSAVQMVNFRTSSSSLPFEKSNKIIEFVIMAAKMYALLFVFYECV